MSTLTSKEKDLVRATRAKLHELAMCITACHEEGIQIGFNIHDGKVTEFTVVKQMRVNVPLELGDA